MYHWESAGNPNIPITIIRYNKSNIDKEIRSLRNVSVKVVHFRFVIKTTILKVLPNTPMQETAFRCNKIFFTICPLMHNNTKLIYQI